MKTLSLALLGLGVAMSPALSPALGQELVETWRIDGFSTPESALYDAANDRIIVGNMATTGAEAGEDGYLSLVSVDGERLDEQWLTGLQDPRGMAIVGDQLFVADNMGFHIVALADGSLVETIVMDGAAFPNDVTADSDGAVYISDMFAQTIWRYENGEAAIWFGPDDGLTLPNGLLARDGQIVVGSMGDDMGPGFTFGVPGGLYAIDIASREVTALEGATDIGAIDGVAAIGETIIFNDNPTGAVYGWTAGGEAMELANVGPGGADLSAYDAIVLVPNLRTGEVIAFEFTE